MSNTQQPEFISIHTASKLTGRDTSVILAAVQHIGSEPVLRHHRNGTATTMVRTRDLAKAMFVVIALTGAACGFDAVVGPEVLATTESCVSGAARALPDEAVAHIITGYADGAVTRCSGALIGPSHVVTAAHCIERHGVLWRNVSLGENPQNHHLPTVSAAWVAEHRPGSGYAGSDVGLLTIAQPVTSILPLSVARLPPYAGQEVVVSGYGNGDCNRDAGIGRMGVDTIESVGDTGIILAPGGATGLGGDSGGPITIGRTIHGIQSWVSDDGHNGAARLDLRYGWLIEMGWEAQD